MTCSACAHENPPRAKFCLECGAALTARCPSCATELPPAAKFCLDCGADVRGARAAVRRPGDGQSPTPQPGPRSDARKIVTILFADLAGSTALHVTWHGSRDGTRYEITFVIVLELDDQGTPRRNDIYDPEKLDQAFARFDEIGALWRSPIPKTEGDSA